MTINLYHDLDTCFGGFLSFFKESSYGLLTWPDVKIGPKEASKPFGQFPLEQLIIILAKIKIMVVSGFSVAFQLLHSRGEGQNAAPWRSFLQCHGFQVLVLVLVETAVRF